MKTAIITGASRGIGAATAQFFSEKGYNVCINYLHSELQAKKIASQLHSAITVKADVGNSCDAKRIIEKTIEAFGDIDVLINNAGIALPQNVTQEISNNDFDLVMNTNIKGVHNMVKEVLPYFINKKSGNIINIASIWGINGGSCETVYAASKSAVIGYTKSLAAEVGPSGIRVNCIAPGFIDTEMNKHLSEDAINCFIEQTPLGRIGSPDEIAKVAYFLASEESSFITGQTLCVDGGYTL